MSEKVFYVNVTEVYKVWANDSDEARTLVEKYNDGDINVLVKYVDSDCEVFEI